MATDIASKIRQGFDEIWHKGNLSFIDEWFSPDFVFHGVLAGDLDREGFKQFVRTVRNGFPGFRLRFDDVIVSGDAATVRWSSTGIHGGEFLGVAPTGRSVSASGLLLMRFAGEQGREIWGYEDALELLRQLGIAPQLGASAGVQPPAEASRPSPEAHH